MPHAMHDVIVLVEVTNDIPKCYSKEIKRD